MKYKTRSEIFATTFGIKISRYSLGSLTLLLTVGGWTMYLKLVLYFRWPSWSVFDEAATSDNLLFDKRAMSASS